MLIEVLKFVAAILLSEMAGVIGAVFTAPSIEGWYATLNKPAINPPGWVFGPVWTTIYFLIGVSLYIVWSRNWKVVNHIWEKTGKAWNPISERLWVGDLQKVNAIGLFILQYILNVSWSLVFFGLHQPGLALFVIAVLWVSIIYVIANFYRISKLSAWLLAPYILWVSFAMYLNYAIWILNL